MINRNLKDKVPHSGGRNAAVRYPSSMEKKRKCKCRKENLPRAGRVVIRCAEHRGKPSKRTLAYFDPDGIVRLEP